MASNGRESVDSKKFDENVKNEQTTIDSDDKEFSRQSSRYGQNVKNYETEWRDLLLLASESGLRKLKEMAVSGELKTSKFRSVCWNVLLGGLNNSPETWIEQRSQQRVKYHEIRRKHIIDTSKLQVEERDNPLSQSNGSFWNQHFRDTELRNLITQDVVRTNPTVEFYHRNNIKEIMIDILFCYGREFPEICYRQGMHEVLANLIFVLHSDHQNLSHIQDETEISLDRTLQNVLNPTFLEEDSYHLFAIIMQSLELFYRINDMTINSSGQLISLPTTNLKKPDIEVLHQLNNIKDKIFAKQDLHLHNHLLKLEISMGFFGIRWLRLLFGREFNLLDLLILWDAIFGVGENLIFTHYVLVAMLVHVRDKLIPSEYPECMSYLMRYPQDADVMLIIRHALFMKSPEKFPCPPNAFVYVATAAKKKKDKKTEDFTIVKLPSNRTSVAFNNTSNARINLGSTLSSIKHGEASKPNVGVNTSLPDDGIVDGYTLDDPQVLKMELQDNYNLMSVSRSKLMIYLSVLRKHIPGNQVDELHQALNGIEELCSLLKPKNEYLFSIPTPVDPAFEAADEDTLQGKATPVSVPKIGSSPKPKSPFSPKTKLNTTPTRGTVSFSVPGPSTSSSPKSVVTRRSFPMSPKKNKSDNPDPYEVPNNKVDKAILEKLKGMSQVELNVMRQSDLGYYDSSEYPQNDPVGERRNSQ
ncbi:CLUMA_CG002004, isoform A [Clunio marinus]|uniref:CLUMA_CG002004, isoform A n=1 Tax=Clunio marinus TaxID=568069 RepID=A0A1J1HJK9_9DIPT|nr:CLUMA_CG002004, isoform A [Clunio marinus]